MKSSVIRPPPKKFKAHKKRDYILMNIGQHSDGVINRTDWCQGNMKGSKDVLTIMRKLHQRFISTITFWLQLHGIEIRWSHLQGLFEDMKLCDGMVTLHKLKREHVFLTSYSRMRVRLAAQVLKLCILCDYLRPSHTIEHCLRLRDIITYNMLL